MGNAELPSRGRRRVAVLIASVSVLAIATGIVIVTIVLPAARSLFASPSGDCYAIVNGVANELDLATAGRVLATATQDSGSFHDCSAPQYDATLEGADPATTLESRLAADGFERQIPGVWQRSSDGTRVRIAVERRETQVVIDVVAS